MLLEENINLLLGKMIGLANGLYGEPTPDHFESDIRNGLTAIADNRNVEAMTDVMTEDKKELLPNCLTCQARCGRTDDFFLNAIENEAYRDKKIKMLEDLLKNQDAMSFDKVIHALCSLSF